MRLTVSTTTTIIASNEKNSIPTNMEEYGKLHPPVNNNAVQYSYYQRSLPQLLHPSSYATTCQITTWLLGLKYCIKKPLPLLIIGKRHWNG